MTTMKGLLKGLRYISQIFDNVEEEEIQIGHPTDVKHVAHIGTEGVSANTPSWMNDFKGTSEVPSLSSNGEAKNNPAKSSHKDLSLPYIKQVQNSSGAPLDSPTRRSSSKKKQSRQQHPSSSSAGSPTRDSLGGTKPRKHKNSGSLDSPTRESSNQAVQLTNSKLGSEDPPMVPKDSHRKKSKGQMGNRSNRSTRSKGPNPLTGGFHDPDLEPSTG